MLLQRYYLECLSHASYLVADEQTKEATIMNRQDRVSLDESMQRSMLALELDDVLNLQAAGAQILDVRDPLEFAGAHLRRTLNIGIDGRYATWAGTMLDKQHPIVVIAEPDRAEEAIMRLGRIGFDHVRGYLKEGMDALQQRPDLVAHTQRVLAPDLDQLAGEVTIVDIRAATEVSGGKIPGSKNIPLNELRDRLAEVPTSGQVVVHCAGGYRSSIAASLLAQQGHENVLDLVGGYQAWLATQSERPLAGSTSAE